MNIKFPYVIDMFRVLIFRAVYRAEHGLYGAAKPREHGVTLFQRVVNFRHQKYNIANLIKTFKKFQVSSQIELNSLH